MTIYEIKRLTIENHPFYFQRKTLQFFGQTMKSFSVIKQRDGRYRIYAPIKDRYNGKIMGSSIRYFNPSNNVLEQQ